MSDENNTALKFLLQPNWFSMFWSNKHLRGICKFKVFNFIGVVSFLLLYTVEIECGHEMATLSIEGLYSSFRFVSFLT